MSNHPRAPITSPFSVEWRTGTGIALYTEAVRDENDARRHAKIYGLAYPTLEPWFIGTRSGAYRLCGALRPWVLTLIQERI